MKLIVKEEPYSQISEAYRTLRTNIEFTALEAEHKVIMVTSSGPQEGKSITIANLALALGESKKKVLLVDCDMRRPRLHKIFKLSNEKGISNVLAQQYPVEQAIYHVEGNVDMMPCGTIPPNPLDLLGSSKMRRFIEKTKERYDYVLLDTPPVMAVADAQVLSILCDGVLLVVAQGKTQKAALTRTKQLIEGVGGKLIGVVLSSIDIPHKLKYGYYHYSSQRKWPNGKQFAFTIIDDTEYSTVHNTKPIYDLLDQLGLQTTKTVWVYPPRDACPGSCIMDEEYLEFIKGIQEKGFEIGLHNVGSGSFHRDEIIEGIKIFNRLLGREPIIHINHDSNPDNIYWGVERHQGVLAFIMKLLYRKKRKFYGTDLRSTHFWGDVCKEKIKYIRNYVFNGINTLKYDPDMPYKVKKKEEYSNYWFSSADAHTVVEFNDLLTEANIERLEREQGCCIVYTHFGFNFVDEKGNVNKEFEEKIRLLASKDGWFVPANVLLDYLRENKQGHDFARKYYLNKLDFRWMIDRIIKKIKHGR